MPRKAAKQLQIQPKRRVLYTPEPVRVRVVARHIEGESNREIARNEAIDRDTVGRILSQQIQSRRGALRDQAHEPPTYCPQLAFVETRQILAEERYLRITKEERYLRITKSVCHSDMSSLLALEREPGILHEPGAIVPLCRSAEGRLRRPLHADHE